MKTGGSMVAAAAVLALLCSTGSAFDLPVHHQMLVLGLPSATAAAISDIEGNFWFGTGNFGSDRNQSDDFRHFDNGTNPAAFCVMANQAWTVFYNLLSDKLTGGDIVEARQHFGALLHAAQDFYSHTNWLEIGQRGTATLFPPPCNPGGLPSNLVSGYFNFNLVVQFDGCPSDSQQNPAPPFPYQYCHLTLNKDSPRRHGADPLPEGGSTYHQAAVALALSDTRTVADLVRFNLTARINPPLFPLSGACLADALFGIVPLGKPPYECMNLSGLWKNLGSNPPGVGGTYWNLSQISPLEIAGTVQTMTCGPLNLLVRRNVPGAWRYEGSMSSCPVAQTGPCARTVTLPLAIVYLGGSRATAELTSYDYLETATECIEDSSTVQYISLGY